MNALEFCVEVLRSGTVQNLGLDAQPAEWEAQLGGDYVDDVRKGRMRRDFGLVELSFTRGTDGWQCVESSIQIHRLATGEPDVVPNPLIKKHGRFEERINFRDLEERMAAEGIRLRRIDDRLQEPHARFAVAESAAILHVVTAELGGMGRPHKGDVWSISLARDFDRRELPIP
ncbi:hypothetical protein [Streptomyces spororaveus]|uniref:hypothetical protein n=1 Tax=Streptomyces spororaveus TaxID=284039 RepID=UPI0037B2C2DC